jgi:hypothetical protein
VTLVGPSSCGAEEQADVDVLDLGGSLKEAWSVVWLLEWLQSEYVAFKEHTELTFVVVELVVIGQIKKSWCGRASSSAVSAVSSCQLVCFVTVG